MVIFLSLRLLGLLERVLRLSERLIRGSCRCIRVVEGHKGYFQGLFALMTSLGILVV